MDLEDSGERSLLQLNELDEFRMDAYKHQALQGVNQEIAWQGVSNTVFWTRTKGIII